MKSNLFLVLIFTGIVSLMGTMVGATLGVFIKNPSKRVIATIVGISAGFMASIVGFDLIPDALEKSGFTQTIIFLVLGIIVIKFIDYIKTIKNSTQNQYKKMAFIMALGIMLHNLPEGIIMGFGFLNGQNLGIKMSILIAIHDIPEGLAVAAPLIMSGESSKKTILYAFLTALPTAIGAWFGIWVGSISTNVLGECLAFASGVMLYVIYAQMIPESNKQFKGDLGVLFGVILGLIMTHIL